MGQKTAIKGPKRGIALYSYSAEFGFEKTLEDCFEDIHDMGATGVEILANTHIENYPYPTDAWVDYWFSLCEKYQVEPVEYGHWIDCRVLQDRVLSTEEAIERLELDMRLALPNTKTYSAIPCWSWPVRITASWA